MFGLGSSAPKKTSGKCWATEPDAYMEPVIGQTGFAAVPPTTVIDVFKSCVEKHGDKKALFLRRVINGVAPPKAEATCLATESPSWNLVWTWKDYYNDCCKFAKSLIFLKSEKFKIVNILGFNSPEWLIANNGAMFACCIAAGIYATNSPEACHYITQHSSAEVVVLDGNKQLAKYAGVPKKEFPNLKALVVYGEDAVDQAVASKCNAPVYLWKDFLELGSKVDETDLQSRMKAVGTGNCSTLIYTSGTTGPPKAVMISHDNITWTAKNMCENFFDLNHTDRVISYLPLSHIAAQTFDIHVPMYLGCSLFFCQPDALKGSLSITMREARPTMFFAVPRVWEKIQEKMVQVGRENSGIKKTLATWAKACGADHTKSLQFGQDSGAPWGYGCAHALVLSKVKDALGLDQCKGCFTAAAPISVDTLNYFASLDIPVFEVFGQSECTGPHTVSSPGQWKVGTCGRPMPGTESIIDPLTGELCYRGRHIFMGYMFMPDKTAETIDEDGYLHSGDVAEFDNCDRPDVVKPSGFMKITGRIKELIITAGGENVAPVLIEDAMKGAMVAVSNCMVIGDRRKYLSMLISLKAEMDPETGAPTDKLAADALFAGKNIGSSATTVTEAAKDPLWKKYFDEGLKTANAKTASNAQIVQKYKLLPADFSEKTSELTPTMKLKRSVVTDKYAALIDSIYADDKE